MRVTIIAGTHHAPLSPPGTLGQLGGRPEAKSAPRQRDRVPELKEGPPHARNAALPGEEPEVVGRPPLAVSIAAPARSVASPLAVPADGR